MFKLIWFCFFYFNSFFSQFFLICVQFDFFKYSLIFFFRFFNLIDFLFFFLLCEYVSTREGGRHAHLLRGTSGPQEWLVSGLGFGQCINRISSTFVQLFCCEGYIFWPSPNFSSEEHHGSEKEKEKKTKFKFQKNIICMYYYKNVSFVQIKLIIVYWILDSRT